MSLYNTILHLIKCFKKSNNEEPANVALLNQLLVKLNKSLERDELKNWRENYQRLVLLNNDEDENIDVDSAVASTNLPNNKNPLLANKHTIVIVE
jgi:chorismate-pyruvate lyase